MALKARLLLSVAIVAMSCALVAESMSLMSGTHKPGDRLLLGQNIQEPVIHKDMVLVIRRSWSKVRMTRFEVLDTTPEGQKPANVTILNVSDPDTLQLQFENVPGNGIFFEVNIYYELPNLRG